MECRFGVAGGGGLVLHCTAQEHSVGVIQRVGFFWHGMEGATLGSIIGTQTCPFFEELRWACSLLYSSSMETHTFLFGGGYVGMGHEAYPHVPSLLTGQFQPLCLRPGNWQGKLGLHWVHHLFIFFNSHIVYFYFHCPNPHVSPCQVGLGGSWVMQEVNHWGA